MKAIELSNTVGQPGELVTVTEHSVPGDGGGGTFEWFHIAPLPVPDRFPEDGGIVFGNPDLTGRWIRLWSGHVNVRWFGARGDGSFDDTQSIQRAIDFCAQYTRGGAVVGGTVFFPPGMYRVAAPPKHPGFMLQLKSHVNLLGCGSSSVLSSAPDEGPNAHLLGNLRDQPLTDVTIRSLRFEGNERAQPRVSPDERTIVFLWNANRCSVVDCIFHDTADAIRFFQNCIGCRVSGNEIYGNGIDIGRDCVVLTGARDTIVENNYIHDCPFAFAINMENAPAGVELGNVIRGNVCKNVGGGVTVSGGCIVSDNILDARSKAAARVGRDCHFVNNRIIGSVRQGIYLLSQNKDAIENVVVANNSVAHVVPGPADGTCFGIVADPLCRHVTIANNQIRRTAGRPTAGPFIGISLKDPISGVTVSSNQICGADIGIDVIEVTGTRSARYFCATQNIITLQAGGLGIRVDCAVKHQDLLSLRHLVIESNIVGRAEDLARVPSDTTGVVLNGDINPVLLVGNDLSDTDRAREGAAAVSVSVGNDPPA
jgi:nitrous oxidase accessory protein NosD